MRGWTTDSERRPSLFRRLLAFVLTLVLALGTVALVANRDKLNMDAIKRYFTYRSLARNSSGQAESFTYEVSASNCFADLDGGLLVCSPNSVRLYSGDGALRLDQAVTLENPVVSSIGHAALVYDAGGRNLHVFSLEGEPFSLSLPEGKALLHANLSPTGALAVVAQESGYKGAVTVYDASYEPLLQINLSSSFITAAAISPDNKWVALVTVGVAASGSFESRINYYRLDRQAEEIAPDYTCSVGNNVCLTLDWKSDGVWLLGENALAIADETGGLSGRYSYAGRYLKAFSLGGEGYAALLLGKYRAGSVAQLVVTDAAGTVTATLPLTDQVLSLSAAGKYISVLTAGKLTVYDQDLQVYNTLGRTQGAQKAIQRADGSVMLISSNSAQLYVPN